MELDGVYSRDISPYQLISNKLLTVSFGLKFTRLFFEEFRMETISVPSANF